MLDSRTSPCLPGSGVSTLRRNGQGSRPSDRSNKTSMPTEFCGPGSGEESPDGQTSRILRQMTLGGELASTARLSSAGASPASPTAFQELVVDLLTSVISGPNCSEPFAKLNHVGSWVRTSQGSDQATLGNSLVEYSGTWPKRGIMWHGIAGKLHISEHPTIENESGFWPTPSASDCHGQNCGRHHIKRKGMQSLRLNHYCFLLGRPDLGHSPTFREWLMGFPIGWTDCAVSATRLSRSRSIRSLRVSHRLRRRR